MTPKQARTLALSFPEAEEAPHFEAPSYRVRGKIFATLHPGRLVVKLTLTEQEIYRGLLGGSIEPVPGAWGGKGWTNCHLDVIAPEDLRGVLAVAWRNVAPKKLLAEHAMALSAPAKPVKKAAKPKAKKVAAKKVAKKAPAAKTKARKAR